MDYVIFFGENCSLTTPYIFTPKFVLKNDLRFIRRMVMYDVFVELTRLFKLIKGEMDCSALSLVSAMKVTLLRYTQIQNIEMNSRKTES